MRLLVDTNIFLDIIFNRKDLVNSSVAFFKKTKIEKMSRTDISN